jgi:hypothetical protein
MDEQKEVKPIAKECKFCNQVQPAYFAGYYGDGKTKRYTDANGKLFCGRACPSCNVIRARLTMQETRNKRKLAKNE